MESDSAERLSPQDRVKHPIFGTGTVEFDKGNTTLVRFEHGIEECEHGSLKRVFSLLQSVDQGAWGDPVAVLTRVQAEAIISVNDTWGVFARSRIALLPHQLWVCRRVKETWPMRWLVADDVGLGKTIEAGLILWPLISSGRVKRLLVLCPAHLVEQWQYRLRTMFDIRLTVYAHAMDTPRSDFWGTQSQVVASLQTMRDDRNGRHDRFFESPPWDLVIVDEAHHLNADPHMGATLGYKFVEQIVQRERVSSMVLFTGTPHRGKDFGFLALLKLLKPDWFDPRRPLSEHLPLLPEVMIRNNKQNVTDLKGNKLFQTPDVVPHTYAYSPEEAAFYDMLTEFIVSGRAYASDLSGYESRAVMLVLIAMQKLASSSIAAIRRALRRRLAKTVARQDKLDALKDRQNARRNLVASYENLAELQDEDSIQVMEEQIAELSAELSLMHDEEPRLRELLEAAELVTDETKIARILDIVREESGGGNVLFFTEYKATQSLLMSALLHEYGDGCVVFINGDERAEGIIDTAGKKVDITCSRERATERFNSGEVRFLVSTEAGGEGIDLQERCSALVHVDLPWNPMRLHQRVGRLNRYGQASKVRVVSLRNPATVESRIWEKLNEKLNRIMLAFGHAMDEPEDLLQLVLGMASPGTFQELFAEGNLKKTDSLDQWFDAKTASLGGKDVIETVKSIVGHCAKFDFQQVSASIPKVDLPDLRPFFVSMLKLNDRRPREGETGLTFKTPETWLKEGVRRNYEDVVFDRHARGKDAAQRVLGVGHKAVDEAIAQARSSEKHIALVSGSNLENPMLVYRIYDRVTGSGTSIRVVTVGVVLCKNTGNLEAFYKDWELLICLNSLGSLRVAKNPPDGGSVTALLKRGMEEVQDRIESLGLPFKVPEIEPFAVLWPDEKRG